MSQKLTELAEGIFLYTTDHTTPINSRGSLSISSIEFELEVRKNKLVIFEVDFTGSTNLALPGSQSLRRKTVVEPFVGRTQVALIQVVDPLQSWALETKYTWLEENPGTVQPGQSKEETLAPGILLTTARTLDSFVFHLSVERGITVTLDCSQSENLSMFAHNHENSAASLLHNTITLDVPSFSHHFYICHLTVMKKDSGYKLRTRWSWVEVGKDRTNHFEDLVASTSLQQQNIGGENLVLKRRTHKSSNTNTAPPSSSSLSLLGTGSKSSQVLQPIAQGNNLPPTNISAKANKVKVKREEISPQVFLLTEVVDVSLKRCEILYWVEVNKSTRVFFQADFGGSRNLQLIPGGGLVCEALVDPLGKMQVAKLETLDPTQPWKLQCKYKWQEEDIAPLTVIGPALVVPAAVTKSTVSSSSDVATFLSQLGLGHLTQSFEAEELTMDLLRVMVKDEHEFRRSLESLGVNKMGQRERIIQAMKQLH